MIYWWYCHLLSQIYEIGEALILLLKTLMFHEWWLNITKKYFWNEYLFLEKNCRPNLFFLKVSLSRFDLQSFTWSPISPLPLPRSDMASVVVTSLFYVIGGYTEGFEEDDRLTEIYAVETNTWIRVSQYSFLPAWYLQI